MVLENNYKFEKFDSEILREYDIRGIFNKTLNTNTAYTLGRIFGEIVNNKSQYKNNSIVVGYDGRLTSPQLHKALCEGLKDSGIIVKSIGIGPTPMTYFAHHYLEKQRTGRMVLLMILSILPFPPVNRGV